MTTNHTDSTPPSCFYEGEVIVEDIKFMDGPAPELNIPLPLMLLAACFGIG